MWKLTAAVGSISTSILKVKSDRLVLWPLRPVSIEYWKFQAARLAWLFNEPLLFPSLGATAFLFFETPLAEVGTPRNAVIGHFVAIGAALGAMGAFGLLGDPSAYIEGVTLARVGAVAVSVAVTGGVLRLLRAAHPPAGATTIIVSSGLLAEPRQVGAVVGGVLLITAAGWGLNRLLGVPAPTWAARG